MKKILCTGCAGFIGSNFVKNILTKKYPSENISFVILDALTYAGHYANIAQEIEYYSHLDFVHLDIRERDKLKSLFDHFQFDGVIHFASESHVDRSIDNPSLFVETNIVGTQNLLENALLMREKNKSFRFMQVSTDEVYGQLNSNEAAFTEESQIRPSSPYSASKASADHLVISYNHTYGLDTVISRCPNNYGPFQYLEKLIPIIIDNAQKGLPIPIYGNGENVRDWIHVDDHNHGVWQIYTKGRAGEVYNLGSNCELKNLDLVKKILDRMDISHDLISFVTDRPGHDFRYAMNASKAREELGWMPQISFDDGIESTITWYQQNVNWINEVRNKS